MCEFPAADSFFVGADRGMLVILRALILQYISHASMQVEHVQCFLLMSSFLCSVNCLPQAWIIVGQAIRISQDIGLHVSFAYLLFRTIDNPDRMADRSVHLVAF